MLCSKKVDKERKRWDPPRWLGSGSLLPKAVVSDFLCCTFFPEDISEWPVKTSHLMVKSNWCAKLPLAVVHWSNLTSPGNSLEESIWQPWVWEAAEVCSCLSATCSLTTIGNAKTYQTKPYDSLIADKLKTNMGPSAIDTKVIYMLS